MNKKQLCTEINARLQIAASIFEQQNQITFDVFSKAIKEEFDFIKDIVRAEIPEVNPVVVADPENTKAKVENETSKPVKVPITELKQIEIKEEAKKDNPELIQKLGSILDEIEVYEKQLEGNPDLIDSKEKIKSLCVDAAFLSDIRNDKKSSKEFFEMAKHYSGFNFTQLKIVF